MDGRYILHVHNQGHLINIVSQEWATEKLSPDRSDCLLTIVMMIPDKLQPHTSDEMDDSGNRLLKLGLKQDDDSKWSELCLDYVLE